MEGWTGVWGEPWWSTGGCALDPLVAPRREVGGAVTFDELVTAVRHAWRSTALWGAIGLTAGVLIGVLRPKNYAAQASFVAEPSTARNLPAGLGGLAAQFGLDVGHDVARSPQFYRELVETSGLLVALLDSSVVVSEGDVRSIRHLLRGAPDNSRANVDRLIRRLRKLVSADVDLRTATVTLRVTTGTPEAAEAVAGLLIGAVKQFNVTTRQLQARELRVFLEKRAADALQALRETEEDLRKFYERNRRFADSPQLLFEESRMKRQLELRQELYTTLSKELESARIEEVNDTPTITVIDPPFASSKPTGPGFVVLAALGLLVGVTARCGLLVLLGR